MKNYYALIMAGGGGTRLWPLSRKHTPKQLLPLIEEHSMFRTSVLRLMPLFAPDHIYVVTGQNYVETLREEAPEIPVNNFVVEPSAKNTAPAVGLAVTVIQKRDPDAIIAILTADHHIGKPQVFRDVLQTAYGLAEQDHIVTLGISPTFPSTAFGYIRQGEALLSQNNFTCYQSKGFTEKPNVVTATKFVSSGQYSWNAGMFIWKASRAMGEFEQQQPTMAAKFASLAATVDTPQFAEQLDTIWNSMPSNSIDFAIMEAAKDMVVIPVDIGWSDVGSWDALFDILSLDKFGNCYKGSGPDRVILDTHNSLVYSGDKLTVTIGLDDIIIVDTEDVLLICHKNRTQDVKDVVNHLRQNGYDDYL